MLMKLYLEYNLSTNQSIDYTAEAYNRLTTAPKGSVACGGLKPKPNSVKREHQAVELFLQCAALNLIIQVGKPDSYQVED
jgi:hypothetical protein